MTNALDGYRAQLLEAAKAAQAPAPLPTPPESPDVSMFRQLLKSALSRGKLLHELRGQPSERQERLMSAYVEDLHHVDDWLRTAASFALARGGRAGQSLMADLRQHGIMLDVLRDGFSLETAPGRADAWRDCFLHLLDGLERVRWVCYRPARRKP